MHSHQELIHRFGRSKEVRKNGTVKPKRLLPAMRSVSNRIFEICPHLPHNIIGVLNVPSHPSRTIRTKIGSGYSRILKSYLALLKQSDRNATLQKRPHRISIAPQLVCQCITVYAPVSQRIEYSEIHRCKHCFGTPERLEMIKNNRWVRNRNIMKHDLLARIWGENYLDKGDKIKAVGTFHVPST
jgi:hypothetical protein